ncbi:MAG: flagellar type III secretion system protein FliR [Rhizobiaceae bacterium]|nr:flagellar type III secretion system protein FliR [Rhizobiaceae bacterium]
MTPFAETVVIAAFLAFCRIGGCFMIMPGLSSARVPLQIRLFLALAISAALVVNLWDQIVPFVDRRPAILVPMIASELLIGGLIGLLARFYMLALQFMGSAIAMMVGYGGMSGSGIESGEPEPALGAMISFSALMLLFVFNFHHEIVRALVESYTVAPINLAFKPQAALVDLTDTLSESFFIMLRIGSPFIAYALLVNLTIGFINKLTPQIPVYFISLPFVVAGGLFILYFAVATMLSLIVDGFLPTTIGRAL